MTAWHSRLRAKLPANAARVISGAGARILAVVASFASATILARVLGPDQYGLYSLGLTAAAVLSNAVALGFPSLAPRETGKRLATGDIGGIYTFWLWMVRVMGATAVIVTLAFLTSLLLVPGTAGPRHAVLMASVPSVPLLASTLVLGCVLLGLGWQVLSILPDQTFRPLICAAGALAMLMVSGKVSAVDALWLQAGAAALSLLLGLLILAVFRPRMSGDRPRPESDQWRRALWPLTLVTGVQLANQTLDTLLLAIWATDAEIGYYRIALSVTQIAFFSVTVGNMMVQSQASGLYARGQREPLQSLLTTATRFGFIMVVVALIVFVPFGAQLLSLVFGAAYAPAAYPLIFLLLGSLAMSYVGTAGVALAMLGGERDLLRGAIYGFTAKLLLGFALAPFWGMNGMAVAAAVSTAITAAIWTRAVRRSFGFRTAAI